MRTYIRRQEPLRKTRAAASARSGRAFVGKNRELSSLPHLQRTIGNQEVHRSPQTIREGIEDNSRTESTARFGHDLSRIPVYPPTNPDAVQVPHLTGSCSASGPYSVGSLTRDMEPLAVFDAEGRELTEAQIPMEEQMGEVERATVDEAIQPSAAPVAAPAGGGAARTLIMGPREMWFFDGETPANYLVSSQARSNKVGGTFNWRVSSQLTLSSAAAPRPIVTTNGASVARNDAWIGLTHTAPDGTIGSASYRMTVRAPNMLVWLGDVCGPDATWGYDCQIRYSIEDNIGDTLPRNVPINEQWGAAPTADFHGMDWRRGPEGAALVNPANWFDHIQGETAGHTPAPLGPADADAAVPVYHWPGDWRVGSLTIGNGRLVATVTWQKYRGFAEHL